MPGIACTAGLLQCKAQADPLLRIPWGGLPFGETWARYRDVSLFRGDRKLWKKGPRTRPRSDVCGYW
jgi:hypothetical protein